MTFHPDATAAALAKHWVEHHTDDAIHLVAHLTPTQRADLVNACLDQLDSVCHHIIASCRGLAASDPEDAVWPANLVHLAGLSADLFDDFVFYVGPPDEVDGDDEWTRRVVAEIFERGIHHHLLFHPEAES